MSEALVIDLTLQTLVLVLILTLPSLLMASVVGLLVSLFQALTQIQEQTLAFGLKLLAVLIVLILTARWIGGQLVLFGERLFSEFPIWVS